MSKSKKLKILMAAAEVSPLAKVGGLADVVGSIAPALQKLKTDTRIIMPLYGSIDKKSFSLKKTHSNIKVPSGRVMINVNIWEAILPKSKVKIYFIDAPQYFDQKEVYLKTNNSERFLFFSYAILFILPIINFEPDIIHCHDSHTALIPDIIKTNNLEYIKNLKTLYTIHNFRYQGKTRPTVLSTGNLNADLLKSLSIDIKDGDVNFMVQGVLNADLINTVSPSYAKEIVSSAYGAGLEKIIKRRKNDLFGILNGIDTDFFNPAKDKYIYKKYNINTINKKQDNKVALQKELGLPINKNKAVVALISRFAWQKGIDLFTDEFLTLDCQFVFLGTGSREYEQHIQKLAKKYPKNISANIKFNVELAQKIYASSDIFLMPSRFEPCGLGQMISMRYGTVPVVRETGGLKDSVKSLNIKKGKNRIYRFSKPVTATGFSFKKIDEKEFFEALKSALYVYYNHPESWRHIQKNCMKKDFSWKSSAKEYLQLYKKILKK
ncbi:glycogen synthase [Candidatus Parcubacteria bacterium]|nr:MAG: glycogen synthase [Candidatus Parcubacteria bacterium]